MEPTWITDEALPLLEGATQQATGSNTSPVTANSEAETPNTHVDQAFPPVVIAQETISQTLNTETKRIMADYTFESLGAFSVYSSIHPLAKISISGNGITATDANGTNTFTLDGATGDATFLGTLKANTIIAGDSNIVMEQGGVGGRIVFYVSGVPVIVIGDPS